MCGLPSIDYKSEFAPQLLRHGRCDEDEFQIHYDTKVLHDGIQLKIRFDRAARTYLKSCGLEEEMYAAEVRETCDYGATIEDMMELREAWKKNSSGVWATLCQEWRRRYPSYTTADGDPAQPYNTTKLVSFDLEEAVYEIGVSIADGDY